MFCITIKVVLENKTTYKNVWLPLEFELQFKEFSSIVVIKALLMLGSHYRFLSIDSTSHRQNGRSRVDTCLQKRVLKNYLCAVPDELNMEKEMRGTFIYA